MKPGQFYDSYWQEFGEEHVVKDPTTPARTRRLKAALDELEPGSKVLDLGCGVGGFTQLMRSWGLDAHGCDVSQEAIRMAQQKFPECPFSTYRDDGTLPFDDETFAAVFSTEVIEHVFDVCAFLAEVNRVLEPNGIFALTTPYHGLAKNAMVMLLNFAKHFDPLGSHIRFFDKRSLGHCLSLGGFAVETWAGVGRVWPLYRSFFVVARKQGPPQKRPAIQG